MNLSHIVQPAYPGQITAEQAAAMESLALTYKPRQFVTLKQLITMAKQKDTPSLKLTEEALCMLLDPLAHRCRAEARLELVKKMSRPLTLVPHFLWADSVEFYQRRVALPRDAKVVARIRKDIQEA